jgi:glycosyltransferase involved in cell wall biosynthesis
MKLIIQIPCLNEEKTLAATIKDLPDSIPGVDKIEVLVIDDGSTDKTCEVAKKSGVDHIVRFKDNRGLAKAFSAGLNKALEQGADIIVNTDADNQYKADDIPKLIRPILENDADIVIGNRQTDAIKHFSFIKRKLQKIGSFVVRSLSGTKIPDTTSGFRAFSKEAALKINVLSKYTYTLETIIEAGKKGIPIKSVPIRTNPKQRKSRLYNNIFQYIIRSVLTIIRIYTMYEPLKTFFYIGSLVFLVGALLVGRFFYYYIIGNGAGHVQSLIIAAVLLITGFLLVMIGLVADIISFNRKILEDTLYRIKKKEIEKSDEEATD